MSEYVPIQTGPDGNPVYVPPADDAKRALRQAFNFHRQVKRYSDKTGRPLMRLAGLALDDARADIASGKRRYTSSPWRKAAPNNGRFFNGKRQWIEKPENCGLRFVGYADELCRNIDHTGWHADSYGDSIIRGVVYQLPGRNGKARFVAGHDNAENGRADSGGPALIDWADIYESDFESEMRSALAQMGKNYHTPERLKPGYWAEAAHETARKEAARAADSFAESQAEREREYDTAWQAGRLWGDTVSEIETEREHVKVLLAERKAARQSAESYPAICATVKRGISESLANIEELRNRRDSLANGDYSTGHNYFGFYTGDKELRAAFNDGADESVL